jgi:integrase
MVCMSEPTRPKSRLKNFCTAHQPLLLTNDAMTLNAATAILITLNNAAWTEDGFRGGWGKACTKANIPDDLTFHDLLRSAVTRPAEAGCETREIATITGHSLKDVEAIVDAHYLGWTTKLAVPGCRQLGARRRGDGNR